jgi:hypothetical protein
VQGACALQALHVRTARKHKQLHKHHRICAQSALAPGARHNNMHSARRRLARATHTETCRAPKQVAQAAEKAYKFKLASVKHQHSMCE